jgi:hypothetical protein
MPEMGCVTGGGGSTGYVVSAGCGPDPSSGGPFPKSNDLKSAPPSPALRALLSPEEVEDLPEGQLRTRLTALLNGAETANFDGCLSSLKLDELMLFARAVRNGKLVSLSMRFNHLSPEATALLAEAIGENHSLQVVYTTGSLPEGAQAAFTEQWQRNGQCHSYQNRLQNMYRKFKEA